MSFAEYPAETSAAPKPSNARRTDAGSDAPLSALAEQAKAQVQAGLEDLQRNSDEFSTEINRTVTTASREGTRFVRENPGMALAGALGVGVLIGLAVRSRS